MLVLVFLAVCMGRVVERLAVEHLAEEYIYSCDKRYVFHARFLLAGLLVFVLAPLPTLVALARLV